MILVAGVGDIFSGDDGFGVEVARRLTARPQPPGVRVADFGIRGLDLAYALMEDWDAAILVDAARLGRAPGTVSVVEPDRPAQALASEDLRLSGHDLDPAKVLSLADRLGGAPPRLLLVACEPLDLGGEDGAMGLTAPVADAVGPAVEAVERLIVELMQGGPADVAA